MFSFFAYIHLVDLYRFVITIVILSITLRETFIDLKGYGPCPAAKQDNSFLPSVATAVELNGFLYLFTCHVTSTCTLNPYLF